MFVAHMQPCLDTYALELFAMTDQTPTSRPPFSLIRIFFTGIAMGIADIIPGVSGGTMAFILGIYEDLLNAIKSFNLDAVRMAVRLEFKRLLTYIPWQFLFTLLLGIGIAFLSLAHAISWLLDNQPVYLFAFFFGLILASILAIGALIRWTAKTIITLIIGTVVAFVIVGMVPLDMPHDPLTLFLSGAVAIMAMILPGISGSFILLILGQYDYILEAVKSLNIFILLPVALGAVIGITAFSRVLSWLLKHYHELTITVLVGFMIGSLRVIWPWKEVLATRIDRHGAEVPLVQQNVLPNFLSLEFLFALLLCLLGFFLVSMLDHLQSRANPFFRLVGRNGGGNQRDTDIVPAE